MQNVDVSQFEIVFKPQSPAPPADTVLQGYFLEITNLEAAQREYALTFTTSSITDPDRQLSGNAAVFVDTPGTNNNEGVFQIVGSPTGQVFRLNRRIVVPARGTALVALLPSDPFPPALIPSSAANFECRGFVTISLPAIGQSASGGGIFFGPQGSGNQKVLLTAQNRGVYTDPDTGEPKGQTQSSVPLATGQSLVEITPTPFGFDLPFEQDLGFDLDLFSGIDPSRFDGLLANLLAIAEQSSMDMGAYNKALRKAGVGLKLAAAK